ncbi:hypothetical protein KI688_000178 [Linnemannia hyalina]|uniref:BHLH domain-containing protein n=1 Tax=Linnemannia hyalina TaxID=64524 RepID=A0A9P7Y441_9FUNG|nr:hypothetical protein KI688_000178 [Linnemannia hyalina]
MAYPAYYPPHPHSQPQHQQPQPHHHHPHPHHPHPHPQHHPYHPPYQPYPPPNYPQQYPSGPGYGHGHPTYYPQPQQYSTDPATASTSASSPAQALSATETSSVTPAPTAKSTKTGTATKTPKAKSGPKTTTASAAGGDTPKANSTPKTPKVFRFEGSISSESFKTSKSFDLAGVNILNRKPLDTKTALDKLQRRRETHNRVERKRRDCINQLIDDLTQLLPSKHLEETTSKCHRVNVLRGAVSHIKFLNDSNEALTKSIRSIKGDDFTLYLPQESSAGPGMSMDVDDEDDDDAIKGEGDSDDDRTPDQVTATMSRSGSPSSSITSTPSSPKTSLTRRMVPPPVIITDAPSPSTDKIQSMTVDPFSAESRQRANSFASSIGDMSSPRNSFSNSPAFPPSPTSPAMFGLSGQFPAGEDRVDGHAWDQQQQQQKQQQLSPYLNHSPSPSPSLPPISSLSNLHIHSPTNRPAEGPADIQTPGDSNRNPSSSYSGRGNRGPVVLPPLMIPEPHHLHPSYQQGSATSSSSGARTSGTGSNRSSLTLSPNPSEQPPISPFMLSPLLPRSPSIGPTSSISPGNSPHPRWAHDGIPSPQPYPPHGSPFGQPPHSPGYGFVYPGYPDPNQQPTAAAATQQQKTKASHHERHKSLQPEPIFIQEEPWNTQRKRSTSSASGKASKSGGSNKKKAATVEEGGSSPAVYPTSPNPKKRTQITTGHETGAVGAEEASKRSKQLDNMTAPEVVVETPPTVKVEEPVEADEEDAAQTLTSLAQISA